MVFCSFSKPSFHHLTGESLELEDPYWQLPPHDNDIILRTKRWMASEEYLKSFVYFPHEVALVRAPVGLPAVIAPKNEISEEYRNHILKFLPGLRAHSLNRAADHLEAWVNGTVQLQPLLPVWASLGWFQYQWAIEFNGIFGAYCAGELFLCSTRCAWNFKVILMTCL